MKSECRISHTLLTAHSLRVLVFVAGVRANRHVHVDVHRGPVPAQRGHGHRVPGSFPAQVLRDHWLGFAHHPHRHLGYLYGQVQIQSQVSAAIRRSMDDRLAGIVIAFDSFLGTDVGGATTSRLITGF